MEYIYGAAIIAAIAIVYFGWRLYKHDQEDSSPEAIAARRRQADRELKEAEQQYEADPK